MSSMSRQAEQYGSDSPSHNGVSPTAMHGRDGDLVTTGFDSAARDKPAPNRAAVIPRDRNQRRDKLNGKISAKPGTSPTGTSASLQDLTGGKC
jgi:hypothetical protein